MKIQSTSTTAGKYWNTLFYRHLGCAQLPGGVCTGISHFETDFWVYYAANNPVQCYEYDPDLYGPNIKYFMSMQFCVAGNSNQQLNLWNTTAGKWEPSAYPVPSTTPGVWHHIQTYGIMDQLNDTYTYEDFVYDGVPVFTNLETSYNARADVSRGNLNIEQQLDGSTTPGAITEYLDNYNFWVW
jgi:hypothetical protein